MCRRPSDGVHKCVECNCDVYVVCGKLVSEAEEGFGIIFLFIVFIVLFGFLVLGQVGFKKNKLASEHKMCELWGFAP